MIVTEIVNKEYQKICKSYFKGKNHEKINKVGYNRDFGNNGPPPKKKKQGNERRPNH